MKKRNTEVHPTVLLESFAKGDFGHSWRFEGLERIITAHAGENVAAALQQVEKAVADGFHAAGFVSYEAASGLNAQLSTRELTDFPLVWFGIFRQRIPVVPAAAEQSRPCRISEPEVETDQGAYTSAVKKIREAIASGDTYQVNYTIGQCFEMEGAPLALYHRICRSQQAPFCAWIDTGCHQILSASPELFFSLKGGRITMKPMKGTAARLPCHGDDLRQKQHLAESEKEQAENLMIVDLVRNDLSMIAETGSVTVPQLFKIETYPTVHQMTSTVCAQLKPGIGLLEIFKALFPCGSVTGAPKRRTMEIIRELETGPRGIYCGAIGYVSPGVEATFSVAIRTAVVESDSGKARIGIGSGITWGSEPTEEYRECLTKGRFLTREMPYFRLIESIRYDNNGFRLLERHLKRLSESAAYFGIAQPDAEQIRNTLEQLVAGVTGTYKLRLLLAQDGSFTAEAASIEAPPDETGMIALSQYRVSTADVFLYHKTTRRDLYVSERANYPDCYDVIFLNQRGEVTEGSYNNVVVQIDGERLTPAVQCGLLPGVFREELLEKQEIKEAIISAKELSQAEKIWLINSVRGWRECRLKTGLGTGNI